MNTPQKVVWTEGMFLTPHHFQQWDRYHEALLIERVRALTPFAWGVSELDIDPDGLVNGYCSVLRLRAVMPDGLAVNIPEEDRPPETAAFGELFAPAMEHLAVFVGVPVERAGAPNCRLPDATPSRPTRYAADPIKVADENTGENPREIVVARRTVKLFFSGQDMADYVTLKIAELVRTPGGTVILRDGYVPPCLAVSASGYLMRLIRGLLEVLSAKSGVLSTQRPAAGEAGATDVSKWFLLQTVNGAIPILGHVAHVGRIHPEALYLVLARLAAELATCSPEGSPKDLPLYQHAELSQTFKGLEQKIRSILEMATPVRHATIPLEVSRENVWVGRVSDERLLTAAQFYVIAGELPEEQLKDAVPRRIKVGALTDVDLIVTAAMPGVRLYHTPRPPGGVPIRPGYQCFRLENHGDFWDSICRSRSIAFYVPADLRGVRLELIAVKE
jgi:type VI secretion system protein ImpJ